MKKKKWLVILSLFMVTTLYSCSANNAEKDSSTKGEEINNENDTTIEDENIEKDEGNEGNEGNESNESNEETQGNTNGTNDKDEALGESSDDSSTNTPQEATKKKFEIYAGIVTDVDYDKKAVANVLIGKNKSAQEQLLVLSQNLSQKVFEGLKIEVDKIVDIGGKKVARINFIENDENIGKQFEMSSPNWMYYFDGSSAMSSTTFLALKGTYFQVEDIDGIQILYNGKDEDPDGHNHFEIGQIEYK